MIYRPATDKGFLKKDDVKKIAHVGEAILQFNKLSDLRKTLDKSDYTKIYVVDDSGEVDDIIV